MANSLPTHIAVGDIFIRGCEVAPLFVESSHVGVTSEPDLCAGSDWRAHTAEADALVCVLRH